MICDLLGMDYPNSSLETLVGPQNGKDCQEAFFRDGWPGQVHGALAGSVVAINQLCATMEIYVTQIDFDVFGIVSRISGALQRLRNTFG